MFGECHAHIIMDGVNYRHAVEVHKNGLINILNILDFRLHTFLDYIVFGLLFLNVIIFGLSKWHKGGSKPLSWYLLPPLISYFHLQTALLLKKRP